MKKILAAATMAAFAVSLAFAAPQEHPRPAADKPVRKMSCCSTGSTSKECKGQMAKSATKDNCCSDKMETQSKASNTSTGAGNMTTAGNAKNPN